MQVEKIEVEKLEKISELCKEIGLGHGGNPYVSGEIQVCDVLNRINKDKLVIFDVGANKGNYSKMIIDKLDKKKAIYCFEPAKSTFKLLKNNLTTPSNTNIYWNNIGFGSQKETKTLFYDKKGSGKASVYCRKLNHFNLYFNKSENIEISTIDDFCKENNIFDLDLLKLDIEGHEYEALKGAENMFKNDKVLLCQFEFGGCNIDSRCFFQDFFYFFNKYNMIICRICPDKLVAVEGYNELYEHFRTTNYLAISKKLLDNLKLK
jgi:FkbM family methyltransferase